MIDSHVHIDAKAYNQLPGGVEEVIREAKSKGVTRFVTPALHLESYQELLEIAARHPEVYPAAGVHPHEARVERCRDLPKALEQALKLSRHPIVGETGLEGHYDFVPMEIQLESLASHLAVAKAQGLPIILHCRKTEEILYKELKRSNLSAGGVIHCFTGTWEWAQRFLELGFHIGITGIVTFKNATDVHQVATEVPLDRLLVETDGPYLAPIPHRGKTNLPQYIPHIVDKIAELRGLSVEEIGQATEQNTVRLFRL